MSEIKNGGYAVTLKGKDYNLLFSLNALDELQDRFGGYDKLGEVFNENNPSWVKDTKWLLTLLINEGLLNEDENAELLNEQQVGRMIHVGNMKEVQQAIFSSFAAGAAGESNKNEKNKNDEADEGNTKAVQES